MGLDVTAYSKLSKLEGVKYLEGEVYDSSLEPIDYDSYDLVAYENSDFPGRAEGIEHRGVYKADDSFGFRAGSYSGYNRWREILAKMAGYPAMGDDEYRQHSLGAWNSDGGPFWELINFSDCEGTIGPKVSTKLAADFAAHDEAAADLQEAWFYESYNNWRKAFEMASDNGAVSFH